MSQQAGLDVMQAVARGWCHPKNGDKEMDSDLASAIIAEVCHTLGIEPPRHAGPNGIPDPLPNYGDDGVKGFPNSPPELEEAMRKPGWPKEIRPEDAPRVVKEFAGMVNGKVDSVMMLPDGSGGATVSFALPKDHWLYGKNDMIVPGYEFTYNAPPMVFRMPVGDPWRKNWEAKIRAAGRYAVRSATMDGKEQDFDPDALVQNLVVGMLGYFTADGLSNDVWANPRNIPAVVEPDEVTRGTLVEGLDAINYAASIFRQYATLHARKGPEGYEKSKSNADIAVKLEATAQKVGMTLGLYEAKGVGDGVGRDGVDSSDNRSQGGEVQGVPAVGGG